MSERDCNGEWRCEREGRLRVQGGADRRLRGGEIADTVPVRSKRVHSGLKGDDRSRVPDSHSLDPA